MRYIANWLQSGAIFVNANKMHAFRRDVYHLYINIFFGGIGSMAYMDYTFKKNNYDKNNNEDNMIIVMSELKMWIFFFSLHLFGSEQYIITIISKFYFLQIKWYYDYNYNIIIIRLWAYLSWKYFIMCNFEMPLWQPHRIKQFSIQAISFDVVFEWSSFGPLFRWNMTIKRRPYRLLLV